MTQIPDEAERRAGAVSDFAENVLPALAAWTGEGARTALVTVVGVEGGAPRPIGAQMAVAQDGRAVGYISGGCLEGALVAEARAAMTEGANRLVRYGAGSPYIDVRLPCGSGLDIYVDQALPARRAAEMFALWRDRRPFIVTTRLSDGASALAPLVAPGASRPKSAREGDEFRRVHWPQTRLLIIGAGPAVGYLARLAAAVGWAVEVVTPDASGLGLDAAEGMSLREIHYQSLPSAIEGDAFSAAAVMFHDHEWELPVIEALLRTDCFYIGAVGSRRVHELRLAKLREGGFSESLTARVRGPAGLIGQTKSPSTLAVSLLAELVAEARDRDYIP